MVGGWPTPLKNMSSSVGMTFPTEWNNEIHVPKHQPGTITKGLLVRLFFRETNKTNISALFFHAGPPFQGEIPSEMCESSVLQPSEEPRRWQTWVPETFSETEAVKSMELLPKNFLLFVFLRIWTAR